MMGPCPECRDRTGYMDAIWQAETGPDLPFIWRHCGKCHCLWTQPPRDYLKENGLEIKIGKHGDFYKEPNDNG